MRALWPALIAAFLTGGVSAEVGPYVGWTAGEAWGDGSGTILRSTDSGRTWIRQGVGQIADVTFEGVFAMDPWKVWVVGGCDDGYAIIYFSHDGGGTWERMGSPADLPDVPLAKVHAYDDGFECKVWAVGSNASTATSAIMYSSDGGDTWANQLPAEYNGVLLQGVYTLDGNTVWVTGDCCPGPDHDDDYALILKSTDAGASWTRQDGGDHSVGEHLLGISAADADTAWAVGGTDYVVLKTTNGGSSWTWDPYFGGMYDVNEVRALDAQTVWVAGDLDVYWSTDGGANWDHASNHGNAFGPYTLGVSAVSSQEGWGCLSEWGMGKIWHTADGGSTATVVDQLGGEDLPGLNIISFAPQSITADYLDPLIIYVAELVEVPPYLLNVGQGTALVAKLEQAIGHLINDRPVASVNVLGAFEHQVDALYQAGIIPDSVAYDLSQPAKDLIELLGGPS